MESSTQKLILIATVTLMVLLVVGNFMMNHVEPTSSYSLNTSNQPTLGNPNSKVEVVVFEEPKCPDCKEYNNIVFPKIKKDFIDSNKIKYIVVPVSFIDGSMPAAEALLCTYYQDDNSSSDKQFFAFLDYMYLHQPPEKEDWATYDNLLAMAEKADPSINLDRIKKCMERHVYHTRIMQNTAEGIRVSRGNLITPAIFINGVKIDNSSPDKIVDAINKVLKN
jgi:protein-disulfide isomerase